MSNLPTDRTEWFHNHVEAAERIRKYLHSAGVDLADKAVADIGCGDGIIDLALTMSTRPRSLVGFDINATDTARLSAEAQEFGYARELPDGLSFVRSEPELIPANDDSFDVVITWSAFEHVQNPTAVLREIRRIMRNDAVLFLQLWPFYHSQHGSHLWQWFPSGFAQYENTAEEIDSVLTVEDGSEFALMMASEFRTLNRLTLDELGDAIRAAQLRVVRLNVMSSDCYLPKGASTEPLSRLAVSGVELLAIPS